MKESQRRFEVVPLEEVLKRAVEGDGQAGHAEGGGNGVSPKGGVNSQEDVPEARAKILCIDDEVGGLKIRKQVLELQGFDVLIAADGPTGLGIASRNPVNLVILDYKMPGMNGEQVATQLRAEHPHIPILLLSAWRGMIPESLLSMVDSFMEKGGRPTLLINEVKRLTGAVRRQATRDEY